MQEIQVQYTTHSDAWHNSVLQPRGVMVHSTAAPGVSAQTFRDRWDRPGVGASVHYFLDDKDIIQCLPLNKRAGHCAGTANSTHIAFEICEPKGLIYNQAGSAIIEYHPPAGYFQAAWENAVGLCAMLCEQYSFDPDTAILSHAEGHDRGIASNHADTGHWFVWEKKTMDDFRAAVKERMQAGGEEEKGEEEEMAKYNTIEEVPEWGRNAVQKLIDQGALQGNGEALSLSEDFVRIVTVLDRLGLFD